MTAPVSDTLPAHRVHWNGRQPRPRSPNPAGCGEASPGCSPLWPQTLGRFPAGRRARKCNPARTRTAKSASPAFGLHRSSSRPGCTYRRRNLGNCTPPTGPSSSLSFCGFATGPTCFHSSCLGLSPVRFCLVGKTSDWFKGVRVLFGYISLIRHLCSTGAWFRRESKSKHHKDTPCLEWD